MVAELLRNGEPIEIEPEGFAYASPIFLAAYFGQTEVVQLLLDHGARIDIKEMNGNTPYEIAMQAGYPQTGELLGISAGVKTEEISDQALHSAITMIILGQMDVSEA